MKHPGFCSEVFVRGFRMPRNYIKVFGERAVRLVEDRLRDNLGVSETRVIADTAMKLGTSREPLRRWVMRARVDAGVRPRVSTEESAELKRLRQEKAELRRTNIISKLASHPQCSGEMTHKNCASREVISSCHDLWYVKQSFRMSKTDLRARTRQHEYPKFGYPTPLPAGTAQQTRRKQILSDLAFRSDFGHTKGRPLCIKMSVPSVELRGFEPLTFSLRTRRATNCAIAPKYSQKPKRVPGKFANYEAVGLRSRKITRLRPRQPGRFNTI